jgi:putative hemolysin
VQVSRLVYDFSPLAASATFQLKSRVLVGKSEIDSLLISTTIVLGTDGAPLVENVRDTLLLPDTQLVIESARPAFMLAAQTPVYEALGRVRRASVQLAVMTDDGRVRGGVTLADNLKHVLPVGVALCKRRSGLEPYEEEPQSLMLPRKDQDRPAFRPQRWAPQVAPTSFSLGRTKIVFPRRMAIVRGPIQIKKNAILTRIPACANHLEESMSTSDVTAIDPIGLLAVLVLVAANGFFVAAEFSLVAVRKSQVAELVAAGRTNAAALQRAIGSLDANLAATQLGITISSLSLGWIGEPALAGLIEPLVSTLPESLSLAASHTISIAIAFTIITSLHIVLGELAPKSLALQRTEATALWVARPLRLFLFLLWPAIFVLNGLGNLVLRLVGLRPGATETSLHSAEELKLLVAESQEAGLLDPAQEEVVQRVFSIGDRPIADIMTPRRDIDWVDADDTQEEILHAIRECQHEQLLVGRGNIDEPLGIILKKDLLNQLLEGKALDPLAVMREPLTVFDTMPIFRVLDQFKKAPVRLALVIDEYGMLEGIVTQTDLLEAIAGDLPDSADEQPDIFEREDGSLLIDGAVSAPLVFDRLGLRMDSDDRDYHTIAGFALKEFQRLPEVGDYFRFKDWRFEVVDMDGRRIDRILAQREAETGR